MIPLEELFLALTPFNPAQLFFDWASFSLKILAVICLFLAMIGTLWYILWRVIVKKTIVGEAIHAMFFEDDKKNTPRSAENKS